ncbi:MAG: hypothetical protein IJ029_04655, partial [Lachnospiraceae bacterium]|nr:hypothetical protein [Lachnospiraceae bacterium]
MKQWSTFKQIMQAMGKHCPAYLLGIFFMSTGWAAFSVMTSILLKNVVDAAQAAEVNKIPLIIVGNILGGIVILLIYRA